jgi:hypothetical protein
MPFDTSLLLSLFKICPQFSRRIDEFPEFGNMEIDTETRSARITAKREVTGR